MKISSVNVGVKAYNPTFQKRNVSQQTQTAEQQSQAKSPKLKKALPWVMAATVGVASAAVGYAVGVRKGNVKLPNIDKATILALLALAGYSGVKAESLTKKEMNEALEQISKGEAPSQKRLERHGRDISEIKRSHTNATVTKHAQYYHDLLLLKQNNVLNRDAKKYDEAIQTIETIGLEKLTSTKPLPFITKENPTIWSITSEFAPIKEGGLGSVPPEVRNNAEKLGVSMPTFIPMYLNEGNATLFEKDGKYTYLYKGKDINLEKIATIKMDTYKNGISTTIPVDYYLHTDKDAQGVERQLIFVKADNYFDGTIYEASAKSEEPEKFAVASKAVYEFAKLKMDGIKATKDAQIHSESALESIKEPDGMILNDWQASPTAALLRYKAPMENAHRQLSDATAQKLRDMRVITIGHNAMYQGSTQNDNNYHQKKAATNNILNTLFDKYAPE